MDGGDDEPLKLDRFFDLDPALDGVMKAQMYAEKLGCSVGFVTRAEQELGIQFHSSDAFYLFCVHAPEGRAYMQTLGALDQVTIAAIAAEVEAQKRQQNRALF